jgi:hypothetical protein
MLDIDKSLPNDPDELRQFTALLLAEVKSQAVLIEKLHHQLAGHPLPGRRFAKQICREGQSPVWCII